MRKDRIVVLAFAFFTFVTISLGDNGWKSVFANGNIGLGESGPMSSPTPTGIGSSSPEITSIPTIIPTEVPTATPLPTATPTPTPTPDQENPYVIITNPSNGGQIRKNTTITITADASDNDSVVDVKFYVNGVLKCTDTSSPYACSWLVPKKPNTTYTLNALATDPSGNVGSHTIYVTSY